ncbi:MAG: diversity-generating retroelement protein Avd [Planctomycetota bacterium]|jgi:hypothetical protein
MQAERTPIFVRTYDFVLWLLPHTAKFPKAMRHSFTNRLETDILRFQGALCRASRARGTARRSALDASDGLLDSVRFLVRLAHGFGWLTTRQHEHATIRMSEIGRLLGGWQRAESHAR